MKKRFTILAAAFALLAFLAIPMGMRGQTTVTFTAGTDTGETSVTKDGVTVSMSTMSRTDNYRCYANTAMTIASTAGNITNVELTCTGNGDSNYGPGKFSLTEGYTGSYSYSGNIGTWIGSAADISLSASSQVRMTEIVVTIGGSVPTTFTVTYDCNGGTSGCPENVTGITAGTSITLAAAPTKTDYTFDGWNDGSTTYEAGANYTVNGNVTMTAQWTEIVSGDEHWVIANLADLTEDDVFVIVGNNGSNYAMSNNNGTGSAPSAVAVTVTGNEITSSVASNIKWTVSGDASNGYTFYPYGSTTTWLYCNTTANSSSNNNMRVGTGDRKVFEMNSDSYLMTKDTYVVRYLSIYNNTDWRGYINTNLCPALSFYKKMVGGTVPPSISADDVSVEYDAVSGSIAYTVNNGVDGGTMSAAVTEGDWLTLGQGTTSPISFTCTANQTSTVRTATVTLTYTYNRETTTANVTVTQAANPNAINNISEITAAGTYTVQGTIVAKSARGFIVGDGTGYVYYYNQNYTQADYNIGDMVKLAGSVVVYGGVFEFNNTTTITTATSSNYVVENPTVLTGEQMDARVASTTPPQLSSYVQYEGTLSVNDTHYNITDIVGATTAIGSVSYPLSVDEITALAGKHVKVTGYYVGISSSTYYNTMLGSIEEIATSDPSITAENVSIEYDATSGAIAYTIQNPVNGGILTAATESEWLTLGTVGATVPFTCAANTAASPRTATVTLTYTYNTDQIVTKNVTVTQAGNPNTIDNISDITAAGTYTVQGTIVAISNRGFVLGDGTGYVYYYYGENFEHGDYDIGDMVKLAGSVIVYGKVYEFNDSATITYVEESNYVAEGPTVLSGADMDARVASTTPALSSYVQYEGTFTISGTHYNVTNISGATTAIGSISYPLNGDEITALNGKYVRVMGYYVGISSNTYYNTMIGSIEEVEVQHEEYTLTVSNLVNVNTYVFDAADESEMLLEGEGSVQILDGTMVMISVDVEEGYGIESLIVDGTNVTSQIDETGAYTFIMPTHNVTITATAVEIIAPTDGDFVRISSLAQLTDGSIVVIASRYNADATNYYAMKNTVSGGKAQCEGFVSTTSNGNEILPASIVDNVNNFYWVANLTENGYTFTNANGDVISYNSSSNFNMNGTKMTWDVERSTSGDALVPYYEGFKITNVDTDTRCIAFRNTETGVFGPYSTQNINSDEYNFFLDFFVQNAASGTVTQTIELTAGWNWISTYIDLNEVDGMALLKEALGDYAITLQAGGETADYFGDGEWVGLEDYVWTNADMIMVEAIEDCTIT
ncbi:MAG: InlB B-repeat-containing protein, partial [Bacteroidales bacterium]|nr:InlB B-repeat-containing protein [Bacteroidales bacterium]